MTVSAVSLSRTKAAASIENGRQNKDTATAEYLRVSLGSRKNIFLMHDSCLSSMPSVRKSQTFLSSMLSSVVGDAISPSLSASPKPCSIALRSFSASTIFCLRMAAIPFRRRGFLLHISTSCSISMSAVGVIPLAF